MPPIIGARMKIPNLVELFPPFLGTTDLIATKPNLEVPIVLVKDFPSIYIYTHT